MANGGGNGDGDNEQYAPATMDAAQSGHGTHYDWGFLWDYCVWFQLWPTHGTGFKCKIGQ